MPEGDMGMQVFGETADTWGDWSALVEGLRLSGLLLFVGSGDNHIVMSEADVM